MIPTTRRAADIETLNSLSRNRIVADSYEPGSTFKVVTLSSALDSGTVTLNNSYFCNGGIVVNGERIKCWRSGGHGSQTLIKAVQNSCNPAFVSMALSMGTETFYDYIYAYGMGSSTGSGIPGETGGIVTHQKYMTQNTLARIGFGQSIAVTPIQLCTAVCAAVNGGELMQPYVVDRVVSSDGKVLVQNSPTVVRRVISAATSQTVREILESVVTDGSGRNAQIPGYRVGGKTGTAQKYDETGAVDSGKLIASFVGFAPADDPEFVCLILVDEPKVGVIFGSTVAAPFVKQVMEETLRHYGYLPTENAETVSVPDVSGMTIEEAKAALKAANLDVVYQDALTDVVVAQVPAANESVNSNTEVLLYTENTSAEDNAEETTMVKVPNVVGMSRLEASDTLDGKGLQIKIDPEDQTGKAIRQVPEADAEVREGTQVLVEFSKRESGVNGGSAMLLSELIRGIDHRLIGGDAEIRELQYNSRKVEKGDLFFCVVGTLSDGHQYAQAAADAGAAALVVERELPIGIPQVLVPDTRTAMAEIACAYYGNPSREMTHGRGHRYQWQNQHHLYAQGHRGAHGEESGAYRHHTQYDRRYHHRHGAYHAGERGPAAYPQADAG